LIKITFIVRILLQIELHRNENIASMTDDSKLTSDSAQQSKPTKYTYMQEILPGLFLGSATAAHCACAEELKKANIRKIIDVGINNPPEYRVRDIVYVDVSLAFDGSLIPHYLKTFSAIHGFSPQNAVLIHCKEGVSRSVALLMAYLIFLGDGLVTVNDVLSLILNARPKVNPDRWFILQLNDFFFFMRFFKNVTTRKLRQIETARQRENQIPELPEQSVDARRIGYDEETAEYF
jgi:hypothetical protein